MSVSMKSLYGMWLITGSRGIWMASIDVSRPFPTRGMSANQPRIVFVETAFLTLRETC
jgi:hypothetical protein